MTSREYVLRDIEQGKTKINEAVGWLSVEGLDLLHAMTALRAAENYLAKAREELARVSREALTLALDQTGPNRG